MTTVWNTERIIRASKILACLHGILGVWMIVVSTIAMKTFEQDVMLWWFEGLLGLIGGILMMINVALFAYPAFKGSEIGNDLTINRIRIMMTCSGVLSFTLIGQIVALPLATDAVEISSQSISMSDSKNMRKWLSINQIIVGSLGFILALSAATLALRFANYFTTATFRTSRVESLRQLHHPQEQPERCSRGKHQPSQTAFTISDEDENVNNSMNREPTPPPSYFNLSVTSSVISNYRASSTYSAHGTPPPNYTSVMQTMTRINPTPPPSYDNLSVHSSIISNYRAFSTYSADGTPPPSYSSVTQTLKEIMY